MLELTEIIPTIKNLSYLRNDKFILKLSTNVLKFKNKGLLFKERKNYAIC